MDEQIKCRARFQQAQIQSEPETQAVILAAGRGRRLGAHVEEFPKCLLQVGGRTLLDHQLSMLNAAGIYDVTVVTGYHHDAVARATHGRAHVVRNRHWATTNSLYSFWLTRHRISGPVVVMNCDVLADQRVLTRLLEGSLSCFAYDSSSGADDEHMKVELSGDILRSMSKTLDVSVTNGENVGILKFSAADARGLFEQAAAILERGGNNKWLAAAVHAFARDNALVGVDVNELTWIEIDYQEDLEAARNQVWPSIEPGHRPGQKQFGLAGAVS